MTPLRLPAAALLALLAAGCADKPRPPPPGSPPTLAWFQPAMFPDLPLALLRGYRLVDGRPQLAVATAGGSLRRLDLRYRSAPDAETPAALHERLAFELAGSGWQEERRERVDDDLVRHWRRADETLVVAAGRDGDATTVRLLLGPDPRQTP